MTITIHSRGLLWLTLLFSIAVVRQAQATDYFVDQGNASANDSNVGSLALPWKTITKANQTLTAGDTVYIKAGTYTAGTSNYVAPVNSGTPTARITYRNYGTDIVTIQQGAYGVLLNGKDYITVQGLVFTALDRFLYLSNGADYNVIDGNIFATLRTYSGWEGSRIYQGSDHNIIRNNTFKEYGRCVGTDDQGSVLEVGVEDAVDGSDYNVFVGNVFARGGHHVMGLHTRFNVVRNNYFYNDPWINGTNGNRTLYMVGNAGSSGFNLIENNRFGYSSVPCDAPGVQGMMIADSDNIVRYNAFYHNNLNGLGLQVYDYDASRNLIYNNTFFNNAFAASDQIGAAEKGAISLGKWHPPLVEDNEIKNNLFYSHVADGNQPIGQNGALRADQVIANNYDGDVSGNPLFVNASTTPPSDKTNRTLPNLTLQAGSPAVNIGGALTTVSSGCSGSTTSIVLANATFFQDGTWGVPSEMQADWIAVGTVGNVQQISAISSNTVTLVAAISCSNSASVWLYKDSTGRRTLFGSAPDAGAYEFGQESAPSAPTNLRITP